MPPSPQQPRTHYDLLGVSRNAALDEIKKRYRELARKHHPDVNPGNPNAARIFSEITSAYKVISDPEARKTYDAELLLQERRAAAAAARAAGPQFPGHTVVYPGGVGGGATPTARPAPPNPQAANSAQNIANEVNRLLQQAQAAMVRMRFVEARDLAQQSLRLRKTAEGYEILGDVYRLQNRPEEAMNMYTMSLQLNPRNARAMERLQRLARSTGRPATAPGGGGRPNGAYYDTRDAGPGYRGAAAPGPSAAAATSGVAPAYLRAEKRPLITLMVAFMGYGAVALLLLYVALYGREAPSKPITPLSVISEWNETLLWALPLAGFLLGITLAVTQAIRRLDDELILTGHGPRHGPYLPMGIVLLVLSVLSFWAAAVLHLILSLLQEARLDSILRVFGAVVAVVVVVALAYEPGRVQVLLFGGNIVFLALALGWFIGDIFRPDL